MTADALTQALTWALFGVIAVAAIWRAARRPLRANVDLALLFGAIGLIILLSLPADVEGTPPSALLTTIISALLMALSYLQFRIVDDFAVVPIWLKRAAELGIVLLILGLFVIGPPTTLWLVLLYVAYFVGLEAYNAVAFLREARNSSGVTRRRLQAMAFGTLCLGLVILIAGFQAALPALADAWSLASRLIGLACGIGFFVGVTPPLVLRRAWQEPELRAFLNRAATLPRLPDTRSILVEMERGAAASLGAHAAIGLWDEVDNTLRFRAAAGWYALPPRGALAWRCFEAQQALFVEDAAREDPLHADLYAAADARAVLAAPVTAGSRRLGVLMAYAPRAPIFAEDDLQLVSLLAAQAAVILESRALIDEAAVVQAREEVRRLKDDFLSSAAHELKTPLTTLLAQAQLLQRRAVLRPDTPPDPVGLDRVVTQAKRLAALVLELVEAADVGADDSRLRPESLDLVEVASEALSRHRTERHPTVLLAERPVIGEFDRDRLRQLLDHLVENAVKYSPQGGEIAVRVWTEADQARISVRDRGIGIPESDLPRLFSRYHRGMNVDDRRFAGLGVGLLICRAIVEEHGGRIWAAAAPDGGSLFQVALPLSQAVRAVSTLESDALSSARGAHADA